MASLSCVQDSCSSLTMLILNVVSQPLDLHRCNISFLQFCSMMLMSHMWCVCGPDHHPSLNNWQKSLPSVSTESCLCVLHMHACVFASDLSFVMQLFDTRPTGVIKSQTVIRYTFKCCHPDQISIFSHYSILSGTHTQILLFFP